MLFFTLELARTRSPPKPLPATQREERLRERGRWRNGYLRGGLSLPRTPALRGWVWAALHTMESLQNFIF